jgi:hypothetical protein
LSLSEISADPKREAARKQTGQSTAKVCRSTSAGAGKQNCPATLSPGIKVTIVAEKAGGAWLEILAPEQIPGFGPKEPTYVMAAFVEEIKAPKADQVPQSSGPPLEKIMRLDQTIPVKGLAKKQPNYADVSFDYLESAPLGPDITLFLRSDPTRQKGIGFLKSDFYIDDDPLSGFAMAHNQVYRSKEVAEAVVADLNQQTPDTPNYTYYLRDGIIFPTIFSATTLPILLPFVRKKRDQDLADMAALGDLAEAVMWWYVGARIPIKIKPGGVKPAPPMVKMGQGGAATIGVLQKAQQTLFQFFSGLLRSGKVGQITVEGVGFGGVKAATKGTELLVSRSAIINVGKVADQGKLIHGAFEQAAVQLGRETGAKTVRIALETVQNQTWAAHLQSKGYVFDVIANEFGGVSKVLTKVFTL